MTLFAVPLTLATIGLAATSASGDHAQRPSSGAPDVAASHARLRVAQAAGIGRVSAPDQPSVRAAMFKTKQRCPGVQQAVGHYRRAYTRSRTAMGLDGAPPRVWYPCQAARRRAVEWRDRAWQAKRALHVWIKQQWAAPPEPFLSIARCENRGNGLYGVNWDAYNSTYEGAYGFLHSTWDDYKPDGYPDGANQATIAQQTKVARILVATFGGYSSWPACHLKLGLPG